MSRAKNLAGKLARKLGLASIQTEPCRVCGGTTLREIALEGRSEPWVDGVPCCQGCGLPTPSDLVHVHRFGWGRRVGVKVIDLRGAPWRPHKDDPGRRKPKGGASVAG